MAVTEQYLEKAEQRMGTLRQAGHAIKARYDRRAERVVVGLSNGVQIAFPVHLVD